MSGMICMHCICGEPAVSALEQRAPICSRIMAAYVHSWSAVASLTLKMLPSGMKVRKLVPLLGYHVRSPSRSNTVPFDNIWRTGVRITFTPQLGEDRLKDVSCDRCVSSNCKKTNHRESANARKPGRGQLPSRTNEAGKQRPRITQAKHVMFYTHTSGQVQLLRCPKTTKPLDP